MITTTTYNSNNVHEMVWRIKMVSVELIRMRNEAVFMGQTGGSSSRGGWKSRCGADQVSPRSARDWNHCPQLITTGEITGGLLRGTLPWKL